MKPRKVPKSPIPIKIIASGSSGNSMIINDNLMIDCGIPFKRYEIEDLFKIDYLYITHIHGDHLNIATIKKLIKFNQDLKVLCSSSVKKRLDENQIKPNLISPSDAPYKTEVYELTHDVQCWGFDLVIDGYDIIYATDTTTLPFPKTKKYNIFLIEANYCEKKVRAILRSPKCTGLQVLRINQNMERHLSKQASIEFVARHSKAGEKIIYVRLHKSNDFYN